MPETAVGVGAGQQHEDIGSGRECRPGLGPADQPVAVAVPCRRHRDAGDVGAEVGFGDRHTGHDLAGRQLRQPGAFLLLGAAAQEGSGQDLRPGDQRAAGPERGPRQFLGGHDHAQIVVFPARGITAVHLRDRQPEGAQLPESGDDVLGDIRVLAVDALGHRHDALLGEPPEGVGHQFEVGIEVAGPGLARQGRQPRRVPVGGHEARRSGERTRLDTPMRFPAEQTGGEVPYCFRCESGRQAGLYRTVLAVIQGGLGRLDGRRAVGQVVGDDLVDLGGSPASIRQMTRRAIDDRSGHRQCGCRSGQVRSGLRHGVRLPTWRLALWRLALWRLALWRLALWRLVDRRLVIGGW